MFSCEEEAVQLNFDARVGMYGAATHDVIDGTGDAETQYVTVLNEAYVLVPRPTIPFIINKTTIAADGLDFTTISGLHDPCDVVIDAPDPLVETQTATVTGGSFEFSAETEGIYTIQIQKFPFLPLTLQITAIQPEAPDDSWFSSEFSYEFGS
jgi:hypothetical protein